MSNLSVTEMERWLTQHPNAYLADIPPHCGFCDGEEYAVCTIDTVKKSKQILAFRNAFQARTKKSASENVLRRAVKDAVREGVDIAKIIDEAIIQEIIE